MAPTDSCTALSGGGQKVNGWLLPVLLLMVGSSCETPRSTGAPRSVLAGSVRPAVALTLPRVGGGTIDFSAFRGRPTVVFLFATWSLRAQAEAEVMSRLHHRQKAAVQFVGIALERSAAPLVKTFVDFMQLKFPVGLVPPTSLELIAAFGPTPAVPRTLLLDGDARIIQRHDGGHTDFNRLRRALSRLTGR